MSNAEKQTNPLKAIRKKCLDCCCGSVHEVDLCVCTDCSLYPFRHGRNPYREKRPLLQKQKDALMRNEFTKASR